MSHEAISVLYRYFFRRLVTFIYRRLRNTLTYLLAYFFTWFVHDCDSDVICPGYYRLYPLDTVTSSLHVLQTRRGFRGAEPVNAPS